MFAQTERGGNTYQDKVIQLTADITMPQRESWEPLQNFAGTFDGNGKRITGLTIDKPNKQMSAYSGVPTGSIRRLQNIVLISCDVKGYSRVGGAGGRSPWRHHRKLLCQQNGQCGAQRRGGDRRFRL